MQTLFQISKSAAGAKAFSEGRTHFGNISKSFANQSKAVNMNNSPNPAPEPDTDRNEEGFIIVKEGEGVFYIRYDIIFAKAGDIFFMPRKVPKDFNADSDNVTISLKDNPGEFEKFFNTHFQPYKAHVSQVSERVPTKDEFEQFIDLSGSLK